VATSGVTERLVLVGGQIRAPAALAGESRTALVLMMLLCAGVTALITANGSVAALVPVVVMAVRLWRESAQLLIPLARGLAHRRRP
jgi:hypothetical protein